MPVKKKCTTGSADIVIYSYKFLMLVKLSLKSLKDSIPTIQNRKQSKGSVVKTSYSIILDGKTPLSFSAPKDFTKESSKLVN